MIRVVIDTNVWVSGLLSNRGAPARIVDLVFDGMIVPILSPAMLAEYEDVLRRPELALPRGDVQAILNYLRSPGAHIVHVDPAETARVCTDPDDDSFAAAAVEGTADYLISGNAKHFPRSPWRGIRIVMPHHFLRIAHFGEQSAGRE